MAGVGSEQVITFSLYPGSIFDGPLVAVVLHTLIPAALVAHLPAELFRRWPEARPSTGGCWQ